MERDTLGCRSYKNKSINEILQILSNPDENISSIVLSDNSKFEFYAELFNSNSFDWSKMKELTLSQTMRGENIKEKELGKIFARVRQLESLVCSYDATTMELLKPLKNLRAITIRKVPYEMNVDNILNASLNSLTSLTKLIIECEVNGIKILKTLSENAKLTSRLTELFLHMPCDFSSLQKIKTFSNLEVLSMGPLYCNDLSSIVFRDFPRNLRLIKIDNLRILYKNFLSLVQELKVLKAFDLGGGDIFFNSYESCGIHCLKVISLIEDGLELTGRTLRIMYSRRHAQEIYETIHRSRHLEIIKYTSEGGSYGGQC